MAGRARVGVKLGMVGRGGRTRSDSLSFRVVERAYNRHAGRAGDWVVWGRARAGRPADVGSDGNDEGAGGDGRWVIDGGLGRMEDSSGRHFCSLTSRKGDRQTIEGHRGGAHPTKAWLGQQQQGPPPAPRLGAHEGL